MVRECGSHSDLVKCLDIFYDVFTSPPWEYSWMDKNEMRRYFTDLYRTPGFVGYMYYDGGVLLGACMGCISDYFLHAQYDIKEIFIHTNAQNKGVGSKMLSEIEADLVKRKVICITLMTQRNIPAYHFYLKNEFISSDITVHMTKVLRYES